MQRLLTALALLAASGLAIGPADAAQKRAKCADATACKSARHAAVRPSGSYEPTIERDGYVINRRNDSDPRTVTSGGF
jgi:hypothetical protein